MPLDRDSIWMREGYAETRAPASDITVAQASLIGLAHLAGNIQTQPGTGALSGEEGLEQRRQVIRRDARAVIDDIQVRTIGGAVDAAVEAERELLAAGPIAFEFLDAFSGDVPPAFFVTGEMWCVDGGYAAQ